MRTMSSIPHCVLAGAMLCSTALVCSPALEAQGVAPKIRIVNRIDESNLVTLRGNTHPGANAKNDRGRVSPDLPMTDLILVLSRSPEQQAAFETFVAGQYDPESPDFHHWLTPAEVGQNFGPSETDIATISNWLTGHGLSVDEVTNDRMSIRFSGTAAQVESTFHTEIHNLLVKNVAHIANMSDPQIPAALTPVVVGVKALHNFFPRPLHRMGSQVTRDAATGQWKRPAASSGAGTSSEVKSGGVRPEFGINVPGSVQNETIPYTVEDVTPYDFATIYNVLPLWNAGIDGTGQTIAIAGTSDINLTDVATFRTFFGLPTSNAANTPIRISGNSQPLTVCTTSLSGVPYPDEPCGIDDLIENSLDVEWSGAVAKNAQIVLVASYPASNSDDNLYDSESYIVNHLTARIMNVSYGECELGNGTAGNVEYYDLWQTAAAEGIAVFVASGDAGAASCDDGGDANGTPYVAEYGLSVSGLASTPFDTAVGGTDFNWCPATTIYNEQISTSSTPPVCSPAPYWNSANSGTGASVSASGPQAGYVPEVPWNETCTSPLALGYLEDWANNQTYFGISGVHDAETACNFALDSYGGQVDLSYLIDTVGGGGGASGCVVSSSSGVCSSGSTSTGATTNPDTGTAQASISLYNNGWIKPSWQMQSNNDVPGLTTDGVRDIPDVSFFSSDGLLSESAYLICVQEAGVNGDQPCTYATNAEPFASEVGGTSASTPAMAGVMALINQKAGAAQGNPNAELYKLAAQQTYSSCSAETVKASSTACYFNDIDAGTNAMPCDYGANIGISPNCTATEKLGGYADDVGILTLPGVTPPTPGYNATQGYDRATGLGSLNVANVVNEWPAEAPNPVTGALGTSAAKVSVVPASTSVVLTQSLSVTGAVASSPAGGTAPTGTVTLTAGSYSFSASLSAGGYSFTVPANSLACGISTINVAYGGDATYSSASGQAFVTGTGLCPTVSLTQPAIVVTPSSVTPGANATATVMVSSVDGYAGTVTLTCQFLSTTATGGDGATCTGGGGAGISLSSTTTSGTAVFTVSTSAPLAAALAYPRLPGKGRGWESAGGAVLALLIFLGIPARRRSWRSMLGVLVVMAALGSLSACGGGGGGTTPPQNDPGTTKGVYTFTVQATGNPSVTPAVSTTFAVTVN